MSNTDNWGMTTDEHADLARLAGRLSWHYADCEDIIKITEPYSASPGCPPNYVTVSLKDQRVELIFLQRTDWAQERSETWHLNVNNGFKSSLVDDSHPALDYTGPSVNEHFDFVVMWAVSQIERAQNINWRLRSGV